MPTQQEKQHPTKHFARSESLKTSGLTLLNYIESCFGAPKMAKYSVGQLRDDDRTGVGKRIKRIKRSTIVTDLFVYFFLTYLTDFFTKEKIKKSL